MAYVYRHIRLDKNVPFYIGIGSDNEGEYKRAHHINRSRNKYWSGIVGKTAFDVEILFDGLTWEEACIKEKEFISIYKRRNDGGTLANLTLGGEGQLGMYGELNGMYGKKANDETKRKQSLKKIGKSPPNKGKPMPKHLLCKLIEINKKRVHKKGIVRTDEWRRKQSEAMKGKPSPNKGKIASMELRLKMSESRKGRKAWNKGMKMSQEYNAKLKGVHKGQPVWNKGIPMSKETKIKLSASLIGKPSKNKGRKKTPDQISALINSVAFRKRTIFKYALNGGIVDSYSCAKEAAQFNSLNPMSISACCRGTFGTKNRNSHGGFIWSYNENLFAKQRDSKDDTYALARVAIAPTLKDV